MKKIHICVFTGTRAEYGLLRPFMELVRNDKSLGLQIIVSGMHLSRKFGYTYREIVKDGFKIDYKAIMPVEGDSPLSLCSSVGAGLTAIARGYQKLKPDAVVILGDRFEALSAAIAAVFLRIPIIHLHGGESTFGLIDEPIRHAITKMSWLHFTSTEKYRNRVIQLGENPEMVFNVGAIGLDNIAGLNLLSRAELCKQLNIDLNSRIAAITFHPVTLDSESPGKQFSSLLDALQSFPEISPIFTMPNADPGNSEIVRLINEYVKKNGLRARAFTSLGQLRYLSLLKHSDIVIGNSSSGIIEAPSFFIPTVNIGDRQKGRVQGGTIINCFPRSLSIV
ncbi:MAG: UDP-N-acetylglucosamine 2-epimerase, partial [Elusimicrobiota bacterium]|nr:UDP-N-acetylglucosamine 2-epimerase [Elusimicrobiota bacterium]